MLCGQPLFLSGEVSIAVEDERAFGRAMAWLALYVPTIGTSVVLHVAVVLLAAFLIPFHIQKPPEFEAVRIGISDPAPKLPTKHRERRGRPASRHFLTPQPETFIRQSDLKVRGVGETPGLEHIPVIGIGSGRLGGGDLGFNLGGPEGPVFPIGGVKDARIVYVVDRSGSMSDSLDYVKYELKRSIAELGADCEFHVIFYSSGPPVEMPTRRLVPATDRNKDLAFQFIDRVIPMGETDPAEALERAFACRPQTIYLLTDGEFDRSIVDLVRRLNTGRGVAVHTIGFLYDPGPTLRDIAAQNSGRFKFVSEKDLLGPGM